MAATSSRKIPPRTVEGKVVPRPSENGDAPALKPLLVITGEPEDERREPLFEIDGTTYNMVMNPPNSLMISYLDMARKEGVNEAFSWAMEEMLDEDGYQVLLDDPRVSKDDFQRLAEIVIGTLLGADMRSGPGGNGVIPKRRNASQRR